MTRTHQRLSPHCDIHQGQQGSQSLIEGQQDSEPSTQTLRGSHVLQEVGVPALAHKRGSASCKHQGAHSHRTQVVCLRGGGESKHDTHLEDGGAGCSRSWAGSTPATSHWSLTRRTRACQCTAPESQWARIRTTTAGTCKGNILIAYPCDPTAITSTRDDESEFRFRAHRTQVRKHTSSASNVHSVPWVHSRKSESWVLVAPGVSVPAPLPAPAPTAASKNEFSNPVSTTNKWHSLGRNTQRSAAFGPSGQASMAVRVAILYTPS